MEVKRGHQLKHFVEKKSLLEKSGKRRDEGGINEYYIIADKKRRKLNTKQ
jgi:hypothetical protein